MKRFRQNLDQIAGPTRHFSTSVVVRVPTPSKVILGPSTNPDLRASVRAQIANHDLTNHPPFIHPLLFPSSPPSSLPAQHHLADITPPRRRDPHRHALVDTFHRKHTYLRISLTERCNLRCTYCMPAAGVPLSPSSHILTNPEIVHLARLFVSQGVDKIRLTGGEPTLRKGLKELIEELNGLRAAGLRKICMTSNGIALHRKLEDLVAAGLTHLNLSLDTLSEPKFEQITRRRGHPAVLQSITKSLALLGQPPATGSSAPGLQSVKLNVVLTRDVNLEEMLDFVALTEGDRLSVRFIEFMPFSGNEWEKNKLVPYEEALGILRGRYGDDLVPVTDDDGDGTSKRWKIRGWKGEIGFISSMSDHFCSTCNRLRITADGSLKVCLFDNTEVSLRDVLRSSIPATAIDERLLDVIGVAVGGKKAKHAGMEDLKEMENRSMVMIGAGWGGYGHAPTRRDGGMATFSAKRAIPLYLAHHAPTPSLSLIRLSHSSPSSLPKLTHLDSTGRASMVSISTKSPTVRRATAQGRIYLPATALALLKKDGKFKKGDVLGVARIAGIMGGKRTSDLIPLCHPLGLSDLKVGFRLEDQEGGDGAGWVVCEAMAECEGKTGVEMEALSAVSVALLTVWDMVKAVAGKEMRIEGISVVRKTGGKSGDWERDDVDRSEFTL